MSLRIIQLIVTELETRGCSPKEQAEGECCRRITQYWDMKGNLCFEYDPHPAKFGDTGEGKMTHFCYPEQND